MLIVGVVGSRLLHVFADGAFWDYVHLCTDPGKVDWPFSQAECLSAPPSSGCAFDGPAQATRGVWDEAAGVCHPAERDCFAWAKFWNGGLTFYGGLIGAVIGAWYLFKADRFPFWKGCDMGGMLVPIGLGFGRLGCLLAGCCFGSVTDLGWGLSFPGFSPASEAQAELVQLAHRHLPSLPVHPTQIYESGAAFLLAGLGIFYTHERKRYDGHVFVIFLAGYGLLRFVIEFLRSDERGGAFGLSTSQWIGLFVMGAAVFLHRYLSRRAAALPARAAASASQ
jgi:phosphatidylglycerol:prolipoprotein diacylglycerol transferase